MNPRLALWLPLFVVTLAGSAHAETYQFTVDPEQSEITATFYFYDAGIGAYARFGDVEHSYGEPDPSNRGTVEGFFSADVLPDDYIQLMPGATLSFPTAYTYLPFRSGGVVAAPPGGEPALAQFGFETAIGFSGFDGAFATSNPPYGFGNAAGLSLDFADCFRVVDGGDAIPWSFGNYYLPDCNLLSGIAGVFDYYIDSFGSGSESLVGLPVGIEAVEFDGATSTMTIHVNYTYDYTSNLGPSRIVTSGQIVAVPEPSRWTLLGSGVIGLALLCRHRRRDATPAGI